MYTSLQNFSDDSMTTTSKYLIVPHQSVIYDNNNGHRQSVTSEAMSWHQKRLSSATSDVIADLISHQDSVVTHNGKKPRVSIKDVEDGESSSNVVENSGGGGGRSSKLFHMYLVLGMFGFVAFWLVLMLRVYLPEKYWTWSYIW